MAKNEANKTITLRSFDGECFMALMASKALSNVDAKVLSLVIEYCKKHITEEETIAADDSNLHILEELKKWVENFIDIHMDRLYEIILATNYLDINELLDLAYQKVANMIKEKSFKEIRRIFNIENDFTPEKEEEIHRENQWTFE